MVLIVSWVDDILILGHPVDVERVNEDLMKSFECTCEGALAEYVEAAR